MRAMDLGSVKRLVRHLGNRASGAIARPLERCSQGCFARAAEGTVHFAIYYYMQHIFYSNITLILYTVSIKRVPETRAPREITKIPAPRPEFVRHRVTFCRGPGNRPWSAGQGAFSTANSGAAFVELRHAARIPCSRRRAGAYLVPVAESTFWLRKVHVMSEIHEEHPPKSPFKGGL